MSKWNPYREWLGINIARPNHFELLGLAIDQADSAIIKHAAEATLKRLSERTANLPADNVQLQQIKQQLIQQVRLAFSVLRDPQTREAYQLKLASAHLSTKEPTNSANPATSDKPPITPKKPLPSQQPLPANAGNSTEQTPRTPDSVDLPRVNLVDATNSDSSAIRVSTRPKRRRGSGSSWGIWALIVVLFVVGPMILIGVLFATGHWSLPGLSRTVVKSNDPPVTTDLKSGANPADTRDEPKRELNNPSTDGDPNSSNNQAGSSPTGTPPDRSTTSQATDPRQEQGNPGNTTEETDPPQTNLVTPPPTDDQSSATQPSKDDNNVPEELTSAQREALHQITRALAVLKTSLRYRDYDNAARACNRLALGDAAFDGGSHGPITANDGRSWVSSIRDFWNTVEQQFERIPAGKEFEFRGELCTLIESKGNRFVIRFRGNPESFQLDELPVETLIELAESQGIPDIPLWRLHKATYLLLFADLSMSAESAVRESIELSANDGHDVDAWLRLTDLRLWLMTTEFEIVQGAPKLDNQQVTQEVLQQLGVDDVRQINMELALGLNQQLIDLALQAEDRETRTKQLLVAWQLALTAGDLSRVDQTLSLLGTDYALDRLNAIVESFQAIMTQPLPADQTETAVFQLLKVADELFEQERPSQRLSAALNLARDLVGKLDRPSLRNRIERMQK